jgi:hypothetical protein
VSISRRTSRTFVPILAGLLASLALLPAVAQAQHRSGAASAARYGSTALVLDRAAANALSSLAVSPGLIAPGYQAGGALRFPITNSVASALLTGTIKHAGGISLTKGATEVDLTNFWINLRTRQLSAVVNAGARVPILNLSFSGARVSFRYGRLVVGPVTASLTSAAAGALNNAFGVTTFTEGLVVGKATVRYKLFPGYGW